MEYGNLIKRDLLSAALELAKNTWKRFLGVMGVLFILNIIMAILFVSVIGAGFFTEMGPLMDGLDPLERQQELQNHMMSLFLGEGAFIMIISVGLIYILFLTLMSWARNVALKISINEIENRGARFMEVLSNSFDNKIIKILLITILIGIINFLLGFFINLIISNTLILMITNIVSLLLMIKFILAVPAVVIGDKNVIEALKFSFESISWGKAFKYLIIAIIAVILIFIAMVLIIFTIGAISSLVGIIGSILVGFVFIILGFILYAFIFAYISNLIATLYYRNSDLINELENVSTDFDEHLVE